MSLTQADERILRKALKAYRENDYAYRRLSAVWLRSRGFTNERVGALTKYHPMRVVRLTAIYRESGIEGLVADKRRSNSGNRRTRNMSVEDELAFIADLEEQVRSGQTVGITEIAAEYAKKTGKTHKTHATVYALLKRHNWSKVKERAKRARAAVIKN